MRGTSVSSAAVVAGDVQTHVLTPSRMRGAVVDVVVTVVRAAGS
jgi:hypothetical protein